MFKIIKIISLSLTLVRLFPAKQTKDIAVYLSLLFGILLYLVIRLLKPEDLADPEKFPDFVDYLAQKILLIDFPFQTLDFLNHVVRYYPEAHFLFRQQQY